jgi:tetratricopeptide (TPR) repeat protein
MEHDESGSACLSESTIVGFLEHRLPSHAVDVVDAHVDRCAVCRLVLTELARTSPAAASRASQAATGVHTPGSPEADSLPRGTTVGRFVVLDVLGRGGMGTVYAAYDPELDRNVALKLLHPSIAGDPEAWTGAQLRSEAQVMARIQHANVVAVHEVGAFRDHLFIAMEHVDGVTLRRWLAEAPRTWRDVVAVFLSAGEGLSAAHQAGVVHCDFKPENVLVGRDRRVRVSDFGIAALKHHVSTVAAGTPGYMAPEALRASGGDARSDQFGFCISLHEALYGCRPFRAREPGDLTDEVQRGLPPAPGGARVPAHLRAVLRRGLALAPSDRYPSMRDLLADLRGRLETRRRLRLAAAAAALLCVAVTATAFIVLGHAASSEAACAGARTKLAGIWDFPRKLTAHTAFLATGLPYAPASFAHAAERLDRYADEWVTTRTEVCEATEVRHEQSAALLDRRIACLDDLAIRMRVIAETFVRADVPTIRDAVLTSEGLPVLASCSDIKALLAVVPPPSDPVLRAQTDALLASVTQASTLLDAGKPDAAARATPRSTNVRSIGYAPLAARHSFLQGRLASWRGEGAEARTLFKQAAAEAEAGGIDETKARALLKAAQFADAAGDADETERLFGEASATSRRLGTPPAIEAELAQGRGRVHNNAGRFAEALAQRQRVVALMIQVHGAADVQTANARIEVAESLRALFRGADALVEAERAARDLDAALGAAHPDAASAHAMHAMLRFDRGHHAEALAESSLAYDHLVAVLGPRHSDLAGAVTVAGNAHLALHHYDPAFEMMRRAVTLTQDGFGPDHAIVRGARLGLAQGLLRAGRAREATAELKRILAASARPGGARDYLDGLALVGLGSALVIVRKPRMAAARCEEGIRILDAQLGRHHVESAAARGELAQAVVTFDRRRAIKLLEEAVAIEVEILGASDPRTGTDRARLGKLLYQSGHRARGRGLVAEVHDLLLETGEAFDSAELARWLQRHPA